MEHEKELLAVEGAITNLRGRLDSVASGDVKTGPKTDADVHQAQLELIQSLLAWQKTLPMSARVTLSFGGEEVTIDTTYDDPAASKVERDAKTRS